MSSYADITTQLTDQWVAAVERAKESLPNLDRRVNLLPSGFQMPEFGKNLPGNFPELPSPREVGEANFQVAQRLLEAQRDFTLAVIERATKDGADAGTKSE
jgi:hypothetical protein